MIRNIALLGLGCVLAACSTDARGCADPPSSGTTLLTSPGDSAFARIAPDTFIVRFQTSRGDFFVQVNREWAPIGADRFYNLVRSGFYNGNRFYRVRPWFIAQWGVNGNPDVSKAWSRMCIPDDPVRQNNARRRISFAFGEPGTRTTQVFINIGLNSSLDRAGFAPFGEVIQGMEVVDSLYNGYDEMPPRGAGPDPRRITKDGNTYLDSEFPRLDSIMAARVVAER